MLQARAGRGLLAPRAGVGDAAVSRHNNVTLCLQTAASTDPDKQPGSQTAAGEGLGEAVRHHVLALLTRLSAVAPSATLFAALVEQRRAEEGAQSSASCCMFL